MGAWGPTLLTNVLPYALPARGFQLWAQQPHLSVVLSTQNTTPDLVTGGVPKKDEKGHRPVIKVTHSFGDTGLSNKSRH